MRSSSNNTRPANGIGLAAPSRILSIYSRLLQTPDALLILCNESDRLHMLGELTRTKPVPLEPGRQEWEIGRLLRTRPYPEKLYKADIAVARNFNRLSAFIQSKANVMRDATPIRIFRQACQKALAACGIQESTTFIDYQPFSFRTRPEPPFSGMQAVTKACVRTEFEDGLCCSEISLNTDIPLWVKPIEPNDPRLGIIPGIGLHEVNHIFQAISRTEGDAPGLYSMMWQEKRLVAAFEKNYSVYRSTLLERQAHLRQKLYLSYLYDTARQPEEYYLYQDLGLSLPENSTQTLTAALR